MAIKLSIPDNSVTLVAEQPATVQTGTTQLEQLLMGTITKIENANVTELGNNALYNRKTLVEACFPNVTKLGISALYACTALEKVFLPAVKEIGLQALSECKSLEEFIANEPIDILEQYAFANCPKLRKLDFYHLPSTGLTRCTFHGSYNIEVMIIRNTDFVPDCDTNAFGKYTPATLEGLYIYVPASMVEAYRSSDAWAGASIRAIEDYPEITGG